MTSSAEPDSAPLDARDRAPLFANTPAPPRPETAQASTRERIIETAERLIRQFGHQKTTVVDIARAANMSPANIYRFFPSKDAINEAVCRRIFDDQVFAAKNVACRRCGAEDRLRALLLELARLNSERSRSDKALQELLAVATSENWSIVADYADRIESILAEIVADGVSEGEFSKIDPQRAGRFAHAAMVRYLHPTFVVDCHAERNLSLDEMINFCLAALRRPQPDLAAPGPADRADSRPNQKGDL